jgi:hypothetical protein
MSLREMERWAMARQGRTNRIVSIFITFILIFSGLFVMEPFLEDLGMPILTEDVAAAPMTVFSDNMDPVLPGWDNTRLIGPDGEPRDGIPGFNIGNEWAVSSTDAFSWNRYFPPLGALWTCASTVHTLD